MPRWGIPLFGAADRNRTGTDFTPRDFKSLVSTYSTTAAYIYHFNNTECGKNLSVCGTRHLPSSTVLLGFCRPRHSLRLSLAPPLAADKLATTTAAYWIMPNLNTYFGLRQCLDADLFWLNLSFPVLWCACRLRRWHPSRRPGSRSLPKPSRPQWWSRREIFMSL